MKVVVYCCLFLAVVSCQKEQTNEINFEKVVIVKESLYPFLHACKSFDDTSLVINSLKFSNKPDSLIILFPQKDKKNIAFFNSDDEIYLFDSKDKNMRVFKEVDLKGTLDSIKFPASFFGN